MRVTICAIFSSMMFFLPSFFAETQATIPAKVPAQTEQELPDDSQPQPLPKPKPPPENHSGATEYQPLSHALEGEINVSGSTRLEPVMTEWLELFTLIYPDVKTEIKAEGSGTASEALIRGAATLGMMSRPMNEEEVKKYKEKKGYIPIEIHVALDALGVYVHWKNPLKTISIPQIDAIFSAERKCGEKEEIIEWKSLGWSRGGKIIVHDFHEDSGSRGYFEEKTLCGGEYKKSLKGEYKNAEEMIAAIAQHPSGLGYASFGVGDYKTRMLKISKARQFPYYTATVPNIQSGKYPLSRFLYLYIDNPPGESVEPMLYEFIKFIFSLKGQDIIKKSGAVPLPPKFIGQELSKLRNGQD